jgi:transposase
MSTQNRTYTEEFKQEAVQLALKSTSIAHTARELGIPASTLHTWISRLKTRSFQPGKALPVEQDIAALIEENQRLSKALSQANEEKAILKKAARYFAQHSQ